MPSLEEPQQILQQEATPPRNSVGLRDVARAAGVSTATVSRVINNPAAVSPKLRARVESVVKHLGWVPDGAARALTTRKSNAIGAVFPTLSHGDFARATNAIQEELLVSGYTLLLACSNYDAAQEYAQVRKFVEQGIDGIILIGKAHHPELEHFLNQRGVPFVYAFVYDPETHGTCVGPDNRKALFRLTNYLIDHGHSRFGLIAQSTQNNDRAAARLEGVRDALAERGLAVRPQHFAIGEWTIAEGRALFRQIMAAEPRPTAVICGNAFLAVGALLESQDMGIKVPDQLSIVGYDDIEIMNHLPIPITTMRVQGELVGRDAARFIIGRVENRPIEIAFECSAELLIRKSSGPAPA
ncbi:LacI family DNA-binding transcriptional regulator [Bradyrhizobium japonicum]|jgi:LacI family transcriptional regulator|uniref:LacI family DNA-binding transcriptional regulator n=1 Tax=Bradyrhizobium TaxID=374 RepID=UPI0007C5D3F3|nr:LacI family DNA-binding transcriptional regulator [Bradyrhizobium japonicum]MBR0735003.1 LacI family DNA-binding transcriptional regulator [Bradyrhizobium japonicum]MBR0746961.1 LacI family DNA-binding transcriptional regulator [Bradyrhizobium japonicum]MBR0809477.1 LacI family DNA-binding transcriptional regulator [Bradyrhizobium japonicum]MCP1763329.1 LacI family transcriptional regulator [Bradyrhizobium japonicum]MCP1785463.1 LacI family transcriptional regulator [Bradyrhizobium japonicu